MLLNRYIAFTYFKNFLIIFIALELFFVGIDIIQNLSKLPNSANLQVLYTIHTAIFGANYTIPLSLIFGSIVTYINLIRSNQLQAIFAMGYSKVNLIKPILFVSSIITILFIILNSTELAYARENAKNILERGGITQSKENLFLKYFDSYIHIKELDPYKKMATNIDILELKDDKLITYMSAKSGYYLDNKWMLQDVVVYIKPQFIDINSSKIEIKNIDKIYTLEGFKPKIMDNIFDNKAFFSIIDSIEAIKLFNIQHIDTNKIKSILYSILFFPLFAPIMTALVFHFAPIQKRFYNLTMFASSSIFLALISWGLLFLSTRLAESGVILPELAIILPIILLASFTIYLYKRDAKT